MENAAVSVFGWDLVLSSSHRSSLPWVYCLVLVLSWKMNVRRMGVEPMWNHSYEWVLIHWMRRVRLWGISQLSSCASSWQLPATKQAQPRWVTATHHRSPCFVHSCNFLWHIKPYSPQESSVARWSKLCIPQYLESLKPMEINFHTCHLLRL